MKTRILLSAAAAAALMATPVFAETTGYVGAFYGNTEIDTPIGDADADAWGLQGAVAAGEVGGINFQADASYMNADDFDADTFSGTAHLFTRQEGYALGGFVGYTDTDGADAWFIGAEGAKFFEQVTLAASVGYGDMNDLDADLWGGNVEARFFATDNFRIDGRLGYANVDTGFGDADTWNIGIGAEYQLEAAPVSFFAGYDRQEIDDVDVDVNTLTVGVRYNWGGTLKDRDRSGATFRPLGGFSGIAF